MKIFHLTWGLSLGGLETMLVNIANEQANLGHEVTIVMINDYYNTELIDRIASNVRIKKLNRTYKSKELMPLIKLNIFLLVQNPDVIHVHAPRIGMVLLPIFKHKIIWTIHDVNMEKKYFKYFANYVSISKCVNIDIKERLNIDAPVIYNGINLQGIKQSTTRNADVFRIVQVSRLMHEKKGQDLLIKSLKMLHDEGLRNIELDFIGEGSSLNYLKQLVSDNGLQNFIHFLGAKPYSYVLNHLCDYDLLVQPSYFEGFGLTVAEGIAAKIPVLVSNIEGPMEIIDNGKYGFYFEKDDCISLHDQIKYIMSHDLSKMIEDSYKYLSEHFDIKITASNYINEYKETVIR